MKYTSLLFGMGFGFLIVAAGFSNYDTIHDMLLLRDAHGYLVMGSAVAVAMPLLWLLERRRWQTLLGGPLKLVRYPAERKSVWGAMVFGAGWAIAGTCPVPALAMLAGGSLLALVVIGGLFSGIALRDTVVANQEASAGIDLGSAPARQGQSST